MAKQRTRSKLLLPLMLVLLLVGALAYTLLSPDESPSWLYNGSSKSGKNKKVGGKIVRVESVETYAADRTLAVSRQNYGSGAPQPRGGVVKAVIVYTSVLPDGREVNQYARLYVPESGTNLPIFAFAPGTTGIGDQCAASLEQPQVKNWANYDSHMVTYAGQGYATVIVDYEGMRDPDRIHHYMVGELEGRSMLDSIRALGAWDGAAGRLDTDKLFVGGFSQGGHAAMWADKIASSYAPDIDIQGVIGFGPVSDVKRTLADVTRGATLNWFGPLVLTSYRDYYKQTYDPANILLPRWVPTLETDAQTHCIDNLIQAYGRQPQGLYTPEFIQALSRDTLSESGFGQFQEAMEKNGVGDQKTTSAKLINQGRLDNVVLTGQQEAFIPKLCRASKGTAGLKVYPNATHYNIMVQSFRDTLTWMQAVDSGRPTLNSCR